jgi:hypothetical protein
MPLTAYGVHPRPFRVRFSRTWPDNGIATGNSESLGGPAISRLTRDHPLLNATHGLWLQVRAQLHPQHSAVLWMTGRGFAAPTGRH